VFIELTLKAEQEEYRRENIKWEDVQFYNNKPCVELIEKKTGILGFLDEECVFPKGRRPAMRRGAEQRSPTRGANARAPQACHAGCGVAQARTSPTWTRSLPTSSSTPTLTSRPCKTALSSRCARRSARGGFLRTPAHDVARASCLHSANAQHYAGDVTYSVDGFLEKNKDLLYPDAIRMLSASKSKLLRSLFERYAAATVVPARRRGWALANATRPSPPPRTGRSPPAATCRS